MNRKAAQDSRSTNDLSQKASSLLQRVRVILINTTHPGNIGAAARAMKVMGLRSLHLVTPKLFPHADAKSWFVGNQALIDSTANRNATLQGAYFMLAARALGLDCGPMSGFDNAMVDQAFFAGTAVKSNFLINLGYGDVDKLFPRPPRLSFDEACQIL